MPYEWNENLRQYMWTPETGVGNALLPGISPDLTMQQAYGLAAGQMFPGYRDVPGASQFLSRTRSPLYGRYLMGYDPAMTASQQPTFQDWLSGGAGSPAYQAGTDVWRAFPGQGQATTPSPVGFDGGFTAGDWGNVVNLARNMAFGAQPTQELSTMPGYNRYVDMLEDPEMASSLVSMATYDPRAGSIYGGLKQAGMNRAYQDWAATRPEATTTDWLGHVAGQQGMIRPEFEVPYA